MNIILFAVLTDLACTCFTTIPAFELNSTSLEGKLTGGTLLPITTPYKFVVSIKEYDIRICTGSAVGGPFILTAAQCLNNIRKRFLRKPLAYKVWFPFITGQVIGKLFNISKINIHPHYVSRTLSFSDIGVIMIDITGFNYTLLPMAGLSNIAIESESLGDAVSFGTATVIQNKKFVVTSTFSLRTYKVRIIGYNYCVNLYGKKYEILSSHICVRPINLSIYADMVDVGSPLLMGDKIAGIFTFTSKTVAPHISVYTKLNGNYGYLRKAEQFLAGDASAKPVYNGTIKRGLRERLHLKNPTNRFITISSS